MKFYIQAAYMPYVSFFYLIIINYTNLVNIRLNLNEVNLTTNPNKCFIMFFK